MLNILPLQSCSIKSLLFLQLKLRAPSAKVVRSPEEMVKVGRGEWYTPCFHLRYLINSFLLSRFLPWVNSNHQERWLEKSERREMKNKVRMAICSCSQSRCPQTILELPQLTVATARCTSVSRRDEDEVIITFSPTGAKISTSGSRNLRSSRNAHGQNGITSPTPRNLALGCFGLRISHSV